VDIPARGARVSAADREATQGRQENHTLNPVIAEEIAVNGGSVVESDIDSVVPANRTDKCIVRHRVVAE
jgi:hypothetical protein